MSSAIEAMGMSLPYDASYPGRVGGQGARDVPGRRGAGPADRARTSGRATSSRGKSLENAYTLVLALGGSTNAVLHLMAIAREAGVEWTLADFDRLGDKVPHLADLKPGGRYVMNDLHSAGGTPAVLKALLDAGLLHGDCLTVHRATLAENLATWTASIARAGCGAAVDKPMHGTGHLVILTAISRRRVRSPRWRA